MYPECVSEVSAQNNPQIHIFEMKEKHFFFRDVSLNANELLLTFCPIM